MIEERAQNQEAMSGDGDDGMAVQIEDVRFSYGPKHGPMAKRNPPRTILQDVNLSIPEGEILCLLGPSGCGKTTLVNLVMGILVPTQGEVRVFGETAPYPKVRNQVGYMPQDDALYEDVTAEENLRFFASLYDVPKSDLERRMTQLFDFTRLSTDRRKLVSNYSGGMKRRLSLAIALVHEPRLLVLDEPTVGLDPEHRRYIWAHLEELASQGTAILITTHVMDEAQRCARIAMIKDGRVIADDSPASICARAGVDNLEDAFLAFENQQ